MAAYDKTLERVATAIKNGNCGRALQEMKVYLTAWPEQHTQERLDALADEYQQIEERWQHGEADDEREATYLKLLQRMYILFANVLHYHRMKASPYQQSLFTRVRQARSDWSLTAIRQEMESFVSDVAMLQLEPEHTREKKSETIYKTHQQQLNQLFEYVMTSRQWTDSVGRLFTDIMTSPTIDSNDQQLIISAVTLSQMNQFDMAKFRMLTDVYRQSQDEAVRQRALTGWVLSIDQDMMLVYPEQYDIIRQLTQNEEVCKELTELQMQLIYCLNAERDTRTINTEIMPDIIKGNNLKLSHLGLVEQEEDPLEDILHPEAEDERMEKLEATFQRMMDMQKQGADIYFGGFSQMKRFPFFYDISNWLSPFYLQHPDIQQYVAKMEGNRLVQRVMTNNMFCNSDKYSFVMAFDQVLNQLPESMRQMVKRGEAMMGDVDLDGDEIHGKTFMRRAYLMDLYRFFRLFSHRSELRDPFNTEVKAPCEFFSNRLFKDTPLERYKPDVVRMMRKNHYTALADRVLDSFPENMKDLEYYLWRKEYSKALTLDPNNEYALAGTARIFFKTNKFDEAAKLYDQLMQQHPEKSRYMLNKAVCMVNTEDYDGALKLLYQLDYEEPDNLFATRALAWALTCCGKLEQAEGAYQKVMAQEQPTADDYHNYGCYLWLLKHVDDAAKCFKKYAELNEMGDAPLFLFEADWLRKRGITDIDINMMETLVYKL